MTESLVRVQIPAPLRRLTEGEVEVRLPAATVSEVIEELERRFPGMKERLCDGDRVKPGLAVAINSRIGSQRLSAAVPPDAEVNFVHSVSGG